MTTQTEEPLCITAVKGLTAGWKNTPISEAAIRTAFPEENMSLTSPVSHPDHYQSSNGIECIQAIAAAVEDLSGMEAVCIANVIKYVWRYRKKNGVEDLEKARQYLDWAIAEVEKE